MNDDESFLTNMYWYRPMILPFSLCIYFY